MKKKPTFHHIYILHLHLRKALGPTKGHAHHCKTLKNKLTNKYIDKIQKNK